MFLTVLFHYISSLPIEKSVLFAAILSATLALFQLKLTGRVGERERRSYSIRLVFTELIVVLGAISALYIAGLDLQASISGGLLYTILAEVYYAFQRYNFSRSVAVIRRIVVFASSAINCYTFVVQNVVLSTFAGLLMVVVVESEYLTNRKLLERGLVSARDLEMGARLVIIAPASAIGAVIGGIAVGISMGTYDVTRIPNDLRAFLRAVFLLILIFLPLGSLIGWARLFLEHEGGEVTDK